MKTTEQIVNGNEKVLAMAAEYAQKIAKGNYTLERATKDMIDVAVDVCFKKLNGRPALSDNCYGRAEAYKEFAEAVYEAIEAVPEVGMACTQVLFSDKYAHEVVKVFSPKKIAVRMKDYKIEDYYAGDCKVLDKWFREDDSIVDIFTLRKGGGWVQEGQPNKFGSVVLALGYARTYRDPSF